MPCLKPGGSGRMSVLVSVGVWKVKSVGGGGETVFTTLQYIFYSLSARSRESESFPGCPLGSNQPGHTHCLSHMPHPPQAGWAPITQDSNSRADETLRIRSPKYRFGRSLGIINKWGSGAWNHNRILSRVSFRLDSTCLRYNR